MRFGGLFYCSILASFVLYGTIEPTKAKNIVPSSVQHRVMVNKNRKHHQQREFEAWKVKHAAAAQWPHHQQCESDGECRPLGLQASIRSGHGMVFCSDCSHVEQEGLFGASVLRSVCISHMHPPPCTGAAPTWETEVHSSGAQYHIVGEVVHAVPNDASTPLLNVVGGAIVMVQRGVVAFATKVRHCQDAGAVAVVIVDTMHTCDESLAMCAGHLGGKSTGPLGSQDVPGLWKGVHIPAVLISGRQGSRMRSLVKEATVFVEGHGQQVYIEERG